MMEKIITVLFLVFGAHLAHAQYRPVEEGSSVQFTIKNFGFASTGSFNGLEGTIRFDPQHLADAAFDVGVNAASVNTDNTMRDEHLRKAAYFDVEKYPKILLVSSGVTSSGASSSGKGTFVFSGKLTIKGHTKEISFPFSAEASEGGGYRFKGSFTINRKDFDIGGTSTISDKLDVMINVMVKSS